MPEISGCLCKSAHGIPCHAYVDSMCGRDVCSRCSGFSVSDVLEKASHAPKLRANATKMLISDLIAVAIYSTNLKDLNCYGDARASGP